MKTEAEMGVMLPQAKDHPGPPEAGRGKDPPLEPLERVWHCQQLDFRFLASRIVRECISGV